MYIFCIHSCQTDSRSAWPILKPPYCIQTEDAIQLASFVLLGPVGGTGMETDIDRIHCQNAGCSIIDQLFSSIALMYTYMCNAASSCTLRSVGGTEIY